MKANAKILAIAVVAMFCTTAFVAAEMSENAQAANTKNYHIYFEYLDDKAHAVHELWIDFSCEPTQQAYADAATKAMQSALKGFTDIGDINGYSVTIGKYGLTFNSPYDWSERSYATAVEVNGAWAYASKTNYQDYHCVSALLYPAELSGYGKTDSGPYYFYATEKQCADGVSYLKYDNGSGTTLYDMKANVDPIKEKSKNTILYVAIAIIAILVILALAYYFLVAKKKNAVA